MQIRPLGGKQASDVYKRQAKSIEEIKSFLSKQKETYKVPYETHPADRLRQGVFAGTTNRQDFLPRDRTGNRRIHRDGNKAAVAMTIYNRDVYNRQS